MAEMEELAEDDPGESGEVVQMQDESENFKGLRRGKHQGPEPDHCQLMAASFSVTSSSSKEGSSCSDSTRSWAPSFCVCPSPFKFSGSNFNEVPSSGSPGLVSVSSSISVASSSL